MAKLDLSQAEFLFHSAGLADVELSVFRFEGRESLSQPFEFQIELVSQDAAIDLEAPIGQPACLTLRGRQYDGARYTRYVHGVIERFVQLSAGIRHSRYLATLVPTIKPLYYTRNARIFQRLSAPDVAQKVLQDGKLPADWIHSMLHGSYGLRDYCVQYQESDLNFIQRLWEEEGIFYFFEHEKDKDRLALGDGGHAFESLPHYSEVQLRDQPHLYEECLTELRAENALRPGAALLRDFKFKQPLLDMEAKAESDRFTAYQMYYFPGEYVDPALGKRLATVRLEEQQCQRSRYLGTGNVRAMMPGGLFTLSGHRRGDCNQEYLLVSVEHEGTQPQALGEEGAGVTKTVYRNRIECIHSKVPFRPARRAETPSIPGVQTAVVVGPPGEEIHCDSHGRVKVQFHWDREGKKDDNSSCWIRVSQPWGGSGQGGMFIPRIGQEVVVQFLEGDPDRPLIVGRVYNGENPVPHSLPASKNISTIRSASTPGGGGFNELKFDDSNGSELIFFHAQKDLTEVVGHDHSTSVTNDQTNTVGGNQTETVKGNQTVTVTDGDQENTVKTGKQTETIKKDQTITVTDGNQDIAVKTGHSSLTVKQDRTVTVQSGNHNVNVESKDSNLTVKRHHTVVVQTGHSTLTVGLGNHTTNVDVGHHVVHVKTGHSGVFVDTGAHTTKAKKTVVVQSTDSGLELLGKGSVHGKSESDITLEAPLIDLKANEITLSAVQKITLIVGPSSVTVEPSGVTISGPQVNSSAIGTHSISGALIKLN